MSVTKSLSIAFHEATSFMSDNEISFLEYNAITNGYFLMCLSRQTLLFNYTSIRDFFAEHNMIFGCSSEVLMYDCIYSQLQSHKTFHLNTGSISNYEHIMFRMFAEQSFPNLNIFVLVYDYIVHSNILAIKNLNCILHSLAAKFRKINLFVLTKPCPKVRENYKYLKSISHQENKFVENDSVLNQPFIETIEQQWKEIFFDPKRLRCDPKCKFCLKGKQLNIGICSQCGSTTQLFLCGGRQTQRITDETANVRKLCGKCRNSNF